MINRGETYKVNIRKHYSILLKSWDLFYWSLRLQTTYRWFSAFLWRFNAFAFPAVLVDAIYAAIYIKDHPDYEELWLHK